MKQGVGAGALGLGGALMAAASGGSIVGVHESLMSVATNMAQGAGFVLPPAFMVAFLFKESTAKTTKLEVAAKDWADAANKLSEAAQTIRTMVKAIPYEAWTMDDRPLYESAVEDFGQQLDALAQYIDAVQISIMVVAYALFTYSIFAFGMAVYLDALAICVGAAAAASVTVVGAPASATVIAECQALASTGLTITAVATGVLAAVATGVAMVMGGGALLTANSQQDNGATGAFDAFKKAVVTGGAAAGANLLQGAANSGLNFLNRSGVKMFPLAEVDFDADRDIENTWNVGGGVKLTTPEGQGEAEAGYHAKIKDGHVQGQELEAKGKWTHPGSDVGIGGGGKLEWDENENLKNKSVNVGVEHGPSGSKVEYEANWDENNKYSDKYNVNTPIFNRTDGSFEKKQEDPPPPWDQGL
ncbi:hypothetical protein [Actinomadura rubrobrunea]|uniref:hypothetical protein n=1 Tax=Actinomadura rubrobrunea TaxID=115335 RepID=UPI0011B2620D|nr:hypothetical protein [Actinomadura rubrobrunea]